MTADVICVSPPRAWNIAWADDQRLRHLPVVEDGKLIGLAIVHPAIWSKHHFRPEIRGTTARTIYSRRNRITVRIRHLDGPV